MPELAEVEIVRRGLETLRSARVRNVTTSGFAKHDSALGSVGALFGDTLRRGKWLSTQLTPESWMQIHLGMTGRLDLTLPGNTPRVLTHVHVTWIFDDGRVLRFADPRRFGRIRLRGDAFTGLDQGPEPGDPGMRDHLAKVLQRRSTPVFNVILDQSVCAGVGSYVAQEALWRAGVAPQNVSLSVGEIDLLADALADVVADSLAAGGVSMRDYVHIDGTRGSMFEKLVCYGRSGDACVRCLSPLLGARIGGRGVTWCAACQH